MLGGGGKGNGKKKKGFCLFCSPCCLSFPLLVFFSFCVFFAFALSEQQQHAWSPRQFTMMPAEFLCRKENASRCTWISFTEWCSFPTLTGGKQWTTTSKTTNNKEEAKEERKKPQALLHFLSHKPHTHTECVSSLVLFCLSLFGPASFFPPGRASWAVTTSCSHALQAASQRGKKKEGTQVQATCVG